ncbi:MAG: hypothetical protein AAFP90_12130, partial [Planctomycetota bacterium]
MSRCFLLMLVVLGSLLCPPDRLWADKPVDGVDRRVLSRTMLIRGEGRRRDWVGRGRLVDLQNGTWAYIYVRGDHHSSVIDRHKQIHIRFSTDQGDSWTDANTLPDGGKVDGFP